jgi:betaine lipid synthase
MGLLLSTSITATIIAGILAIVSFFSNTVRAYLVSMYCNWFRPVKGHTHEDRLNDFYGIQAKSYDGYRTGLLHGRDPLLQSIAARIARDPPKRKLVWADMGGGTGYNIEVMASLLKDRGISFEDCFEHVYIVDLCDPLLEVARQRIHENGWDNLVYALKQDATEWSPVRKLGKNLRV